METLLQKIKGQEPGDPDPAKALHDVLLDYVAWMGSLGTDFLLPAVEGRGPGNVEAMQKLCREAGVPEEKVYIPIICGICLPAPFTKRKDILHLADILEHKRQPQGVSILWP